METLIQNKAFRRKLEEGWCLTVVGCEHCKANTFNFFIEDKKHDLLDKEDFIASEMVSRYLEGLSGIV